MTPETKPIFIRDLEDEPTTKPTTYLVSDLKRGARSSFVKSTTEDRCVKREKTKARVE
jgi:hypothetical protein